MYLLSVQPSNSIAVYHFLFNQVTFWPNKMNKWRWRLLLLTPISIKQGWYQTYCKCVCYTHGLYSIQKAKKTDNRWADGWMDGWNGMNSSTETQSLLLGPLFFHCNSLHKLALIWFSMHFKGISFPLCISKCILGPLFLCVRSNWPTHNKDSEQRFHSLKEWQNE